MEEVEEDELGAKREEMWVAMSDGVDGAPCVPDGSEARAGRAKAARERRWSFILPSCHSMVVLGVPNVREGQNAGPSRAAACFRI